MIIDKKKNKKYDIHLNVRRGEIQQTDEYKYLGEWYNEKGNHTTSINKRQEKIHYFIKQIKYYGNEFEQGKYALNTRVKINKS